MAHEINLNPDGFAFVYMFVKPRHSSTMARMRYKVDSGANCTTISRNELEKLGYDEDWIKSGELLEGNDRPTAATGLPIDDCYKVILPEINLGQWVGYNWPFMTSLSVSFKFLLGTDSMRFFNWSFDYEYDICSFSLISGKRELLFNRKQQSIHAIDEIQDRAQI